MRISLICFLLAAVTIAVYWQAGRLDFVNYDDEGYVYGNEHVRQGLSWDNVKWAFTTSSAANYHPLTWLSFELDSTLFDVSPRGFHLVNVALHVAGTILLFLLLLRMTANAVGSALAAGIFALHPLHVESVAWVSERKDVLSALFFFLAAHAYVSYVRAKGRRRRWGMYTLVFVLFGLALLAKPMIVTFPFVLLLLDYWPLRRRFRLPVLLEKLPLLLLSLACSWVTVVVQEGGGAMMSLQRLSLVARIANAAVSYVRYLGKTLWPTRLSVFYPHPIEWPLSRSIVCVVLLLAITALCLRMARSRPYLIVGWLLFLGMLVPVIGLVQVGWQSIADRYMYLPMIGPALIAAWWLDDSTRRIGPVARMIGVSGASSALLAASILSFHQVQVWRDTRTLFDHALRVSERNAVAHVQLGYLEARLGNRDAARWQYERAIEIDPTYYVTEYNLANLLVSDRPDLAIPHYRRAAELHPKQPRIQNNLGLALLMSGNPTEAAKHFRAAIDLDADFPDPHNNLGFLLMSAGQNAAAEREFEAALRIDPNFERAKRGLERLRGSRPPVPSSDTPGEG